MNNNNNYPNPLKTAKDIEKIVVSGSMRKYFEFKEPLFEGDLCCVDTVGCNLSCIYCNRGALIENPDRVGEFYSPEDAAEKIVRFNSEGVRISGGEPTIGKEHLLELLNLVPRENLEMSESSDEITELRNAYIEAGVVGSGSLYDAEHIACATVANVDLIVSWNFKHIVNYNKIRGYQAVNILNGYQSIPIHSPYEVVES